MTIETHPRRLLAAILFWLATLTALPGAHAQDNASLDKVRQEAASALESRDLDRAQRLYERVIEAAPDEFGPHYNLACVHAQRGDIKAALLALERALTLGFVDFDHLERDPDLAPIRDTADYILIRRARPELLDARGEADLASAREAFGERYRYSRNEALRFNIASSFQQDVTDAATRQVDLVAAWLVEAVMPEGAAVGETRPEHPMPWITLVFPTVEHFQSFLPAPGVGGAFDRDRRLLVSRDLGPSLRHEIVHAIHHRRMMRLGQTHAFWLQEGLGALVEDIEWMEGGGAKPLPNWRTNIAKRLASRARLVPLESFLALDRERFMRVRPLAMYAQAHALCLFLHERGALREYLAAYEAGFESDSTGLAALEAVLKQPARQTDRDLREWLATLPEAPEEFRAGMPSLGVALVETGDGLQVVGEFDPEARTQGETLRRRDIITEVAGREVRTMSDLVRDLSEREVGSSVIVSVRRGSRRLHATVRLVPWDAGADAFAGGGFAP